MGLLEDRERQREQSQRQLYALNEGWPFGDGPLRWFVRTENRGDQVHLVCVQCPQAVFCLNPGPGRTGFTWNLELLKSRVADHVLKVHPEAAT